MDSWDLQGTVEASANQTGDKDYRYVSSHDLPQRYAQRLLIEKELNPRVVMQVGD